MLLLHDEIHTALACYSPLLILRKLKKFNSSNCTVNVMDAWVTFTDLSTTVEGITSTPTSNSWNWFNEWKGQHPNRQAYHASLSDAPLKCRKFNTNKNNNSIKQKADLLLSLLMLLSVTTAAMSYGLNTAAQLNWRTETTPPPKKNTHTHTHVTP